MKLTGITTAHGKKYNQRSLNTMKALTLQIRAQFKTFPSSVTTITKPNILIKNIDYRKTISNKAISKIVGYNLKRTDILPKKSKPFFEMNNSSHNASLKNNHYLMSFDQKPVLLHLRDILTDEAKEGLEWISFIHMRAKKNIENKVSFPIIKSCSISTVPPNSNTFLIIFRVCPAMQRESLLSPPLSKTSN